MAYIYPSTDSTSFSHPSPDMSQLYGAMNAPSQEDVNQYAIPLVPPPTYESIYGSASVILPPMTPVPLPPMTLVTPHKLGHDLLPPLGQDGGNTDISIISTYPRPPSAKESHPRNNSVSPAKSKDTAPTTQPKDEMPTPQPNDTVAATPNPPKAPTPKPPQDPEVPGWKKILWALFFVYSITNVALGGVHTSNCTAQPLIPIFLIVNGVFYLLFFLAYVTTPKGEKAKDRGPCLALLSLFLYVWFILGNVWVHTTSERPPWPWETADESNNSAINSTINTVTVATVNTTNGNNTTTESKSCGEVVYFGAFLILLIPVACIGFIVLGIISSPIFNNYLPTHLYEDIYKWFKEEQRKNFRGILIFMYAAACVSSWVIGGIHKDNCPVQYMIPIFVIVAGVFLLLSLLVAVLIEIPHDKANGALIIFGGFVFFWIIVGNVHVHITDITTTGNTTDSTAKDKESYCDPMVYYYAMIFLKIPYAVIALLILVVLMHSFCPRGR